MSITFSFWTHDFSMTILTLFSQPSTTEFQGTLLLTYTYFIRTSMFLLKRGTTRKTWDYPKPPETVQELSETSQKTTDITWTKPGNNRYPLKQAISYKFPSKVFNTYGWIQFIEWKKSTNLEPRSHTSFQPRYDVVSTLKRHVSTAKRQKINIVEIINVVSMSLLVTLSSY